MRLTLLLVLLMLPGRTAAQVTYQPANVPPSVKAELEKIRQAAGLPSFTVTSYERDTSQQAAAMLVVLDCSGRTCKGVQEAKDQYCSLGDQAIDGLLADQSWTDVATARTVLARELTEVLIPAGSLRQCLMHVVGNGFTSPNHAVDVAPSSIQPAQRQAFVAAVKASASVIQERFFTPGAAEKAFHLEFKRD